MDWSKRSGSRSSECQTIKTRALMALTWLEVEELLGALAEGISSLSTKLANRREEGSHDSSVRVESCMEIS